MISLCVGDRTLIEPISIHHEDGNAYLAYLDEDMHGVLFENGKPLPAPNALHQAIRSAGQGRYSFWKSVLYFSSSDNSDPRSNGRQYAYLRIQARGGSLAGVEKPLKNYGGVAQSYWDHFETPQDHVARYVEASDLTPDERFSLLVELGHLVLPQYRFNWPQLEWWRDADFNRYLRRFGELEGMNTERRWALYQLQRLVAAVSGDTAECGVYEGASSYLICAANRRSPAMARHHHLFDSFAGLSPPSSFDGGHWTQGDLTCTLEKARQNLSEFADLHFHAGWIPTRFADVADRSFSLVHIDVDLYEPTRDSIAFFYPRLNPGGMLLCDDYGCTTCPGATKAIDDFLKGQPERMLALPAGGGFFIKGTPTNLPALS